MNSLTYVHRWMTGLLDDWIIGLMVDHLDPETIRRYPAKAETWFVAPHLTALHLQELGVPTPFNAAIVREIHRHGVGTLRPAPENLAPLAALLPAEQAVG